MIMMKERRMWQRMSLGFLNHTYLFQNKNRGRHNTFDCNNSQRVFSVVALGGSLTSWQTRKYILSPFAHCSSGITSELNHHLGRGVAIQFVLVLVTDSEFAVKCKIMALTGYLFISSVHAQTAITDWTECKSEEEEERYQPHFHYHPRPFSTQI